jgi:hypothetical protein
MKKKEHRQKGLQDIIKHSDLSIIGASEGKKKEQ